MTSRPGWLALAPFLFLCLWSGGYVVAKIGIAYAEPLTLLCLRYGLVVLLMAVLFVVMRPALPSTRADWGHLAVVGVLIQSVYFGMSYLAFSDGVAAGTVALIMSLQPILVGIFAPIWTNERVGPRQWAGLALGLVGTAAVIISRSAVETPQISGLIFSVLGLAGMTAATLWEKRFGLQHHPVTSNLIGFTAGLAVILPLALLLENQTISWTWSFGGALAYLVIGNSLIATSLLLAMIRAGEVSRVSALLFLVPPGAAVLGWLVLGEAMPGPAWAGMAVAGIGVLVATRAR